MVKFVVRKKVTRKVSKKPKIGSFSKRVKSVITKMAEKKVFVSYGVNQTVITASSSNPSSQILMPQLSQGPAQNGRIGCEVRITTANIKGYVNILPYNVVTNVLSTAVMVKLWIISTKLSNSPGISAGNPSSGYFEIGSSTVGMQGNMLDMLLPINKEAWTLHASKKFKIGSAYASATGPVSTSGYYDNSPMTVPFAFSWGKYFKGPIRYSDDPAQLNSNYPINKNVYLVIQAVYADGSTSAIQPAEYHFVNTVEYTDI